MGWAAQVLRNFHFLDQPGSQPAGGWPGFKSWNPDLPALADRPECSPDDHDDAVHAAFTPPGRLFSPAILFPCGANQRVLREPGYDLDHPHYLVRPTDREHRALSGRKGTIQTFQADPVLRTTQKKTGSRGCLFFQILVLFTFSNHDTNQKPCQRDCSQAQHIFLKQLPNCTGL